MDAPRFDRLAKTLADRPFSRRRLLRVGGLGLAATAVGAARRAHGPRRVPRRLARRRPRAPGRVHDRPPVDRRDSVALGGGAGEPGRGPAARPGHVGHLAPRRAGPARDRGRRHGGCPDVRRLQQRRRHAAHLRALQRRRGPADRPPAGQPTADLLVGLAATPGPGEVLARNAIGDAREARVLADGRVGALFGIGEPGAGAASAVWFVFEQHDGRWLIDEIADLGLEPTPAG